MHNIYIYIWSMIVLSVVVTVCGIGECWLCSGGC